MARLLEYERAAAAAGKPALGYYGAAIRPFLDLPVGGYAGMATRNPNYWNTTAGQQELRQRQTAAVETQFRDTRAEVIRRGQIVQSGPRVFPPEELQQRGEIAQTSLAALDALQPFVESGLAGQDTIRQVVGQTIRGTLGEQQDRRKAQRHVQAIARGIESGLLNESQAAGARKQLEEQFGIETLVGVSGYADLVGRGKQMRVARELGKFKAADELGVDPNVLTFDEDGQITLDSNAVRIKQYKMAVEKAESEKLHRALETRRKNLEVQVNAIGQQIRGVNSALSATKDQAFTGPLVKLVQKQNALLGELSGTGRGDAIAPASTTPAESPMSFTRDSIQAAVRRGDPSVQDGKRVLIDGVPAIMADGRPRRL